MKTALRLVVCVVMAAASQRAFARGPMSNGCGDGEANVPFAAMAEEKAIGAEELGGGSGEPGRAAEPEAARLRAEAEREFERHVWTDP
jgi:hypothetical protein